MKLIGVVLKFIGQPLEFLYFLLFARTNFILVALLLLALHSIIPT